MARNAGRYLRKTKREYDGDADAKAVSGYKGDWNAFQTIRVVIGVAATCEKLREGRQGRYGHVTRGDESHIKLMLDESAPPCTCHERGRISDGRNQTKREAKSEMVGQNKCGYERVPAQVVDVVVSQDQDR